MFPANFHYRRQFVLFNREKQLMANREEYVVKYKDADSLVPYP